MRFNHWGLTSREVEVIEVMMRADTNKEIGRELCLSPRTVEHHMAAIRRKMGVSSRIAVALKWDRAQRPFRVVEALDALAVTNAGGAR